jgi:hypothetical protein
MTSGWWVPVNGVPMAGLIPGVGYVSADGILRLSHEAMARLGLESGGFVRLFVDPDHPALHILPVNDPLLIETRTS